MKIAVIGLGKIGLPLSVQFASKGFQVIGLDSSEIRVNEILQGVSPFPEETGLQSKLSQAIKSGKLVATISPPEAISGADVIVVAVPLITRENGQINFDITDSVTKNIGNFVKKGALIC